MISLNIFLKERNKQPEFIFGSTKENRKASALCTAIEEEFADYIIEGRPEDQPFIYLSVSPIREQNSGIAASIVPANLNFKVNIQETLISFIKQDM
ncbi:hypothetical protein FQV26_05815 [Planococcus sp. CPCC 101016]|uniref:hypothetical protein n=1 Tax=Planococcus sp. CPCC 101016 TaxID=2599617 RepID=UPI0011B6E945|nr:hypothetical protein [Planococcus sp. CPCC 101016]TWT07327.1 hypothetical protein FQV26_05815 [Planococcus sp. CPCC 101016]